jgi:hypothetical protein
MQESSKFFGITFAFPLTYATYAATPPSLANPANLLRKFRPIGSVGNNGANQNRDVAPSNL